MSIWKHMKLLTSLAFVRIQCAFNTEFTLYPLQSPLKLPDMHEFHKTFLLVNNMHQQLGTDRNLYLTKWQLRSYQWPVYKRMQEREHSLTKFNRCRRKKWSFRKRQQRLDASHKCWVLHTDTEKAGIIRVWCGFEVVASHGWQAAHFHSIHHKVEMVAGQKLNFNYDGHTCLPARRLELAFLTTW